MWICIVCMAENRAKQNKTHLQNKQKHFLRQDSLNPFARHILSTKRETIWYMLFVAAVAHSFRVLGDYGYTYLSTVSWISMRWCDPSTNMALNDLLKNTYTTFPKNPTYPRKMMVGRLFSFSNGTFSGDMLIFCGVCHSNATSPILQMR